MSYLYRVHGITISSSIALFGVPAVPASAGGDSGIRLIFHLGRAVPANWSEPLWEQRRNLNGPGWGAIVSTAETVDGVIQRLHVREGARDTTVVFAPEGRQLDIFCTGVDPETPGFWPDLSTWIHDKVLGHALRMRGLTVLHASVAVIEGKAVVFLGPAGAGKSTLAAGFLSSGHAVAGDDHAVLAPDKAGFHAWPGPTRLRLWPSSLTVVGGEKDELPRVAQGCEKRFLGPSSDASAGEPSSATVPVRRIYVLEPRQPSLEEAVIVPLLPVQGVRYLLAHRVGTYPLSVRHSASELESLVRLAVSVPVAILHRPEGLETLPAVVRTVCRDVRARVA